MAAVSDWSKVHFLKDTSAPSSPVVDEIGFPNEADEIDFPNEAELDGLTDKKSERHDFRETLLFDSVVIGPSGVYEQTIKLPDSITTWNVHAVGLSGKSGGMCVAKPSKVVTFKEVFLDVKVPYSVMMNEEIEIPVTVFNYGNKRLPVLLYTYGVEDLCSNAKTGEKSNMKRIFVNGLGAETITFKMIPLEAKEISLKFSAMSTRGSDTVVKKLNVIQEFVVREEIHSFYIDPTNTERRNTSHIIREKFESKYDNENKTQLLMVKLDPESEFVVPGFESLDIDVTPVKLEPQIALENTDILLKSPKIDRGIVNQTFTAHLFYTLQYLKKRYKLTDDQQFYAYKYLRNGYNNMRDFNMKDSQMWFQGPSNPRSNGYAVSLLCQVRRYTSEVKNFPGYLVMEKDDNYTCGILEWLGTKQKPDGAFITSSTLTESSTDKVVLTASVVIAYEQCDCQTSKIKSHLDQAIKYLRENIATLNDHYDVAVVTYALALHDTEMAVEANKKLIEMASYNPDSKTRYWGDGKSVISVEASSYALLTQVLYGDLVKATSIVNWLNTRIHSFGSHGPNQFQAIKALAEFAILAKDSRILLSQKITSTASPYFERICRLYNFQEYCKVKLNKLGGHLVVEARGTGVSNLVIKLRYSIATNRTIYKTCNFDMNVEVTKEVSYEISKAVERGDKVELPKPEDNFDDSFGMPEPMKLRKRSLTEQNPSMGQSGDMSSSSLTVLNITICTQDLRIKKEGFVVVKIGMITGFHPLIEDMIKLRYDNIIIDKFERRIRTLLIHFKMSNQTEYCFSFRAQQFTASNLEPGLVQVYEILKTNETCSQHYHYETFERALEKVCFDKVCKCAESSCPPKEPFAFVNAANSLRLKRKRLMDMVCDQNYYFWKVRVMETQKEISRHIRFNMKVIKVLKEGVEKRDDVEGNIRQFVAKAKCVGSFLSKGFAYYILGRDPEPREINGQKKYLYFIDESTAMKKWVDLTQPSRYGSQLDRESQSRIFSHIEKLLGQQQGCNQ